MIEEQSIHIHDSTAALSETATVAGARGAVSNLRDPVQALVHAPKRDRFLFSSFYEGDLSLAFESGIAISVTVSHIPLLSPGRNDALASLYLYTCHKMKPVFIPNLGQR
jgi:hypothetical protein